MSLAPIAPDEMCEFVIHGALAPRLIEWLQADGFDCNDFPNGDDPDALRCIMVTPSTARMGIVWRDRQR